MASIMQILRRIGGAKAAPTSGSAGQIALWKAGTATTDAVSLYAHDGVQWVEIIDTVGRKITQLVTASETAPATPSSGDMWLRPSTKALSVWDGAAWANVAFTNVANTFTQPQIINANSTTAALRVTQSGAGEAFRVEDQANPDTTPFVVDASGNVGIGVPIPGTKFAAGTGTDMVSIDNPAASTTRLSLGSDPTAAASSTVAHVEVRFDRVLGETAVNLVPTSGVAKQAIHIGPTGNVGVWGPSATYPFAVTGGADAAYANVAGAVSYFGLGEHNNPTGANFALMFDRASGLLKHMGGPRDAPKIHLSMNVVSGVLNSPPTRDTPLTGSNVVVDAAGNIGRTSSSIKYKKDVEDLDHAIVDNAIRNLRPVWYRTKNPAGDDKADWSHIGLIAEEVAKVEKRLVHFHTVEVSYVDKPLTDNDGMPFLDENGKPRTIPEQVVTPLETPEPEDVDYARLSVLLLAKVQQLETRLAKLEARP